MTDQNQKRPSSPVVEVAAPARRVEVGVLDVVEAVLVGLPDVDARAGDRLAVDARARGPAMKHGSPGAPPAMSSPLANAGAPSTKNGPKTVDSVASGGRRLLMPTTSIDSPSTSESRMNSWRLSSVMWPVRVRKSIPANHSSSVSCDLGRERVQVADEALGDRLEALGSGALEGRDARRA